MSSVHNLRDISLKITEKYDKLYLIQQKAIFNICQVLMKLFNRYIQAKMDYFLQQNLLCQTSNYNSQVSMFETTSDISIKDNKSEGNNRNEEAAFSLPFIPAKPSSRGESIHHKEFSKKQKLVLPNIKENQAPNNYSNQEPRADVDKKNKNTFAREVQEKLKKVLGGMPDNTEKQLVESYDSQDFDFEAQINKNKEIIKQHKIKKESKANIILPNQKQKQIPKPPKTQKNRNESLYQKRARQYKDQSIENKYLSKRKKTLKDKNPGALVRQSSKDIKHRNQFSGKQAQAAGLKRSKSKAANNRMLSHKSSQKNLQQINKSVNLFDGIQNYLENPREARKESKDQLIGLSLLKAKRDIEDKIKAIDEQLGHPEQKQSEKEPVLNKSYINKQWRRVQFRNQVVQCHDSNFDKQLDRVNYLQQKNAQSLQNYVEQQKILLELDLHRKASVRLKKVSASQ